MAELEGTGMSFLSITHQGYVAITDESDDASSIFIAICVCTCMYKPRHHLLSLALFPVWSFYIRSWI